VKHWYRMEAAAGDPAAVEIHIIDFIGDWIDDYWGFGVTAKAFVDQLSKLPEAVKTIRVHINSPGGDVFAASNIANALREQQASKGRTVETVVDGLAASAASVVMMAGSTIRVSDNALVMIHNPWTIAVGNAADMRKQADTLDTVRDTIVATYQWHSKLEAAAIIALMDAETWMTADEAIANGFATEKVEGLKAAASIDPRSLAKLTVPEKYRDLVDALVAKPTAAPPAPAAAAAADVLRLCREGECLDLAEGLLQAAATVDQVNARISTERETRQQARARETEIRSLCEAAKLPELAAGYVAGGMQAQQVRAHLTLLTAKLDRVEIDAGLAPDQGSRRKPVIDVVAVYAERNKRLPQSKE
jgi:ATP-dependent protease ClpP protease subunit